MDTKFEYRIPCGRAFDGPVCCTEGYLCAGCEEVQFWRNACQAKDRGVAQLIEDHNAWMQRAEAAEGIVRAGLKIICRPAQAEFEKAFLSANGFHTKAELQLEWEKGLSGHMFRAGIEAMITGGRHGG